MLDASKEATQPAVIWRVTVYIELSRGITGVVGPGSNAHGPNEFLHLPTARKLTLCVADVLAEHAKQ